MGEVLRGEPKYSVRRLEAREKQQRALELRMAGRTWNEVAEALGYASHAGAINAVKQSWRALIQTMGADFGR